MSLVVREPQVCVTPRLGRNGWGSLFARAHAASRFHVEEKYK